MGKKALPSRGYNKEGEELSVSRTMSSPTYIYPARMVNVHRSVAPTGAPVKSDILPNIFILSIRIYVLSWKRPS